MASAPGWKCYLNGQYMAATKYAEDAAALVAAWGSGVVYWQHKAKVWIEGLDGMAADSFDLAASLMIEHRYTINGPATS